MKYVDLTHTFANHMPVFPGDPAVELFQTADVAKDGFTHYDVKTGMHVGTHMDGPAHMILGGKFLHEYPPEKFFGRGVIVDARGKTSADVDLLAGLEIEKNDIVLVCFGWDTEFLEDSYYLNYPNFTESFAKELVELGVSIVGMDCPSPDRAPYPVHKILLSADVLILENLTNLHKLVGTKFDVVALPAKFEADSALCRVVAKIF